MQAINRQWRALADDAALDKFQQQWGLRSIDGKPRSTAALLVSTTCSTSMLLFMLPSVPSFLINMVSPALT